MFPGYCPTPPRREANKLAGSGPQLAPEEPKTIIVYDKSTSGVWWLLLGLVGGTAVGVGISSWKAQKKQSSNALWAVIGCLFCAIVVLYALARSSPSQWQ